MGHGKTKFKWQLKISAGALEEWAPLTTRPAYLHAEALAVPAGCLTH